MVASHGANHASNNKPIHRLDVEQMKNDPFAMKFIAGIFGVLGVVFIVVLIVGFVAAVAR